MNSQQQTQADYLQVVKDISDSYIFDAQAVKSIDAQIHSLASDDHRIEAKIIMEGGRELVGSRLSDLLENSLLHQYAMEGFSLTIAWRDNLSSVRMERNTCWLNISSSDISKASAVSSDILKILRDSRAWYRFMYRLDGELFTFVFLSAVFFISMTQAFEVRSANWLWGVSGIPAYVVCALFRKILTRKMEFEIGLAGKQARRRFKAQAIIGSSVLLAGAVGLAVSWVSTQILN